MVQNTFISTKASPYVQFASKISKFSLIPLLGGWLQILKKIKMLRFAAFMVLE